MKDVISEEGYEQEALDGAGLVHVDMIGVPFVGQLVEAIILDIPFFGESCDDEGKTHKVRLLLASRRTSRRTHCKKSRAAF